MVSSIAVASLVAAVAVYFFFFFDRSLHISDIQALEDEVIHSLYGSRMKSSWLPVQVKTLAGGTEKWLTHFLEPSSRSSEKPDLLLLHGYGATSAFTWRVTIPALLEKFNVYAIDMPGFGRTEAPASLLVWPCIFSEALMLAGSSVNLNTLLEHRYAGHTRRLLPVLHECNGGDWHTQTFCHCSFLWRVCVHSLRITVS